MATYGLCRVITVAEVVKSSSDEDFKNLKTNFSDCISLLGKNKKEIVRDLVVGNLVGENLAVWTNPGNVG